MDLELRGARRSSVYGPHELRPFGLLNFRGRQTFHIEGFDAVLEGGLLNVLDTTYERIELFPEPGRSMELRLTLRPMGPRNLQADTTNRSLGAEPVADDSSSSGREATGPGRNRSSQDRL